MKTPTLVVAGGLVFALVCLASAQQEQQPRGNGHTLNGGETEDTSAASSIVSGRLIHQVDPRYPEEAKRDKVEGTVVLQATVDREGNVSSIAIETGDLILAEAAVDAVRDWKFEPYTQNGRPVEVRQELGFNFSPHNEVGQFNPQLSPATLAAGALIRRRKDDSSATAFYRVGHGVTAPRAVYTPDPPYSDTARKAKYQGVCLLSLIVGADGQPRDIQVDRALGMGLDANAVETVSGWKFEPATKDGEPVAVYIMIEVSFHL